MSKYLTRDQALGVLRALIAAAGGAIVSRGWISAETWEWLIGGFVAVIPAVWSWYKNRP